MKQVYYGAEASADGTGAAPPALPIVPSWAIPPGLKTAWVDKKTGKLASRWCAAEDQYLEYFIPGTEPTEYCDSSRGQRPRIPREEP
jgi:hypothetical protein